MDSKPNTVSKAELSDKIWKNIQLILKKRHISQVDLAKMCTEYGYRVTQPELSRLGSGQGHLTLYQMVGIAQALKIPLEQLLDENASLRKAQITGSSFVTDPNEDMFSGYLGTYYTVFHSTSIYDDKFLFGKLIFDKAEDAPVCTASFVLDTGDVDLKGRMLTKNYTGQLVISGRMGIAYAILSNEKIGEICTLEFRHRAFLVRNVQCRMGLVLTASSGELKYPAAHRMLISRCPITEEILEKIVPFLKLGMEREILVSKEYLEELAKRDISVDFDFNKLIDECAKGEYVLVDETSIRKVNRKLSIYEVRRILGLIREYNSAYTSYITEAEDSQIYEILSRCEAREI